MLEIIATRTTRVLSERQVRYFFDEVFTLACLTLPILAEGKTTQPGRYVDSATLRTYLSRMQDIHMLAERYSVFVLHGDSQVTVEAAELRLQQSDFLIKGTTGLRQAASGLL